MAEFESFRYLRSSKEVQIGAEGYESRFPAIQVYLCPEDGMPLHAEWQVPQGKHPVAPGDLRRILADYGFDQYRVFEVKPGGQGCEYTPLGDYRQDGTHGQHRHYSVGGKGRRPSGYAYGGESRWMPYVYLDPATAVNVLIEKEAGIRAMDYSTKILPVPTTRVARPEDVEQIVAVWRADPGLFQVVEDSTGRGRPMVFVNEESVSLAWLRKFMPFLDWSVLPEKVNEREAAEGATAENPVIRTDRGDRVFYHEGYDMWAVEMKDTKYVRKLVDSQGRVVRGAGNREAALAAYAKVVARRRNPGEPVDAEWVRAVWRKWLPFYQQPVEPWPPDAKFKVAADAINVLPDAPRACYTLLKGKLFRGRERNRALALGVLRTLLEREGRDIDYGDEALQLRQIKAVEGGGSEVPWLDYIQPRITRRSAANSAGRDFNRAMARSISGYGSRARLRFTRAATAENGPGGIRSLRENQGFICVLCERGRDPVRGEVVFRRLGGHYVGYQPVHLECYEESQRRGNPTIDRAVISGPHAASPEPVGWGHPSDTIVPELAVYLGTELAKRGIEPRVVLAGTPRTTRDMNRREGRGTRFRRRVEREVRGD